jgi:SAM-dependent methyltransferase
VERIRVAPDAPDFYASTTSSFRVDPRREDDPVLEVLLRLAHPGETWLDVGAGAGRFALPLALRVAQVIAVEPSPGMRAALEEDAAAHGIGNVRAIDARWPMSDPPHADVALIANVGHDVEAIGPFIDALEAAAPRCVAIMTQPAPAAPYAPLWPPLHGEERILLPAFDDLVALVEARGAATRTWRLPRPAPPPAPFDRLLAMARRQTWIPEGDPREGRLVELLKGMAAETPEGWVVTAPMGTIGVVEWRPAGGVA